MKKTSLMLGVVLLIFIITGCREATWTKSVGVVEDVRIITSVTEKVKDEGNSGDAIGGAIMGAFVAGPTGAIVGSVAGASSKNEQNVSVVTEILGCMFILEMDDGKKVKFVQTSKIWPPEALEYSVLLKKGDRLNVVVTPSSYCWFYVPTNYTNYLEGEVLP
jgi:outer membrane lipoprotein SlyB